MDATDRIVVVGAGHGGGTAAALLRQNGFTGSISVFGEEREHPYHRPPLSKTFLTGGSHLDPLRPSSFYGSQGITLETGTAVTGLDRDTRFVITAEGRTVPYDALILATGAEPRRLGVPGDDRPGVQVLRSATDAVALQNALASGTRLVIIGAGYIGLEVAASAISRGVDVVVLQRSDRVLSRVASLEMSTWTARRHTQRGTRLHTSVDILEIRDGQEAVHEVVLTDGRIFPADVVLVAVGVSPRQQLAAEAGIACADDGILVDRSARTSDPRVFAIGDVTNRPVTDELRVRLECIASTTEQARCAAAVITGKAAPEPEVPWFWSDQFEDKTKTAGLLHASVQTVQRRPLDSRLGHDEFALFHLDEHDRVVAVESVNAPALFMGGKKLIAHATPVNVGRLRDATVPLASVACTVPDRC